MPRFNSNDQGVYGAPVRSADQELYASTGQLMLTVTEGSDGYVASFDIGLDMT